MSKRITGKTVARNVVLSIFVQAVSVSVGFIINLIVPKFISEYDYSYWQTYLLYTQYVGVLHFGLIDGIILRYSQYDYDELNKKEVRSQYLAIMCIDSFFALTMILVAVFALSGVNRILCILLAFTIFAEITYSYVSYTFQITNRIKEYAIYIIFYRVLYCVLVILCLISGRKNYFWFCLAYLSADVLGALIIGLRYSKEMLVGTLLPLDKLKIELKTTLSAGAWLMIASYSANLIVGFGKMIVQWHWSALIFGKVSLAYSLASFLLQFVTAISVVLFPSIKRLDQNKLPEMYSTIRNSITPLLIFVLLLYYPGGYLLELWLPNYSSSILYLGILLPMIIFTSKVNLLTNNYLKAYRKEKTLFVINVATVVISFAVFMAIAYLTDNLLALLGAVVFSIMIQSIVSEIVVMKLIHIRLYIDFILEFVVVAAFMYFTVCFGRKTGFIGYLGVVVIYFVIKRKNIIELFNHFFKSVRNKKVRT